MMLEYDGNRRTNDVDYAMQEDAFDVKAAAETMAKEEPDLDDDWLNDHAKSMRFLPEEPDRNARRSYTGSHLTVSAASPERMLAMKMYAGRAEDWNDVKKLIDITGTESMKEAREIFKAAFPRTELPKPGEKLMQALTSNPAETPGNDTTGAGDRGGRRGRAQPETGRNRYDR